MIRMHACRSIGYLSGLSTQLDFQLENPSMTCSLEVGRASTSKGIPWGTLPHNLYELTPFPFARILLQIDSPESNRPGLASRLARSVARALARKHVCIHPTLVSTAIFVKDYTGIWK